jgi:hypothetical protein
MTIKFLTDGVDYKKGETITVDEMMVEHDKDYTIDFSLTIPKAIELGFCEVVQDPWANDEDLVGFAQYLVSHGSDPFLTKEQLQLILDDYKREKQ